MNLRQILRRLLKSQWLQVLGFAFILLELIASAGVAITGNWDLLWLIPFVIVLVAAFFLIRLIIITFLLFFQVWIAIVVILAAFILFKGKGQKKADPEISAAKDTTTPGPAS